MRKRTFVSENSFLKKIWPLIPITVSLKNGISLWFLFSKISPCSCLKLQIIGWCSSSSDSLSDREHVRSQIWTLQNLPSCPPPIKNSKFLKRGKARSWDSRVKLGREESRDNCMGCQQHSLTSPGMHTLGSSHKPNYLGPFARKQIPLLPNQWTVNRQLSCHQHSCALHNQVSSCYCLLQARG